VDEGPYHVPEDARGGVKEGVRTLRRALLERTLRAFLGDNTLIRSMLPSATGIAGRLQTRWACSNETDDCSQVTNKVGMFK
jgi:hypothetical protein